MLEGLPRLVLKVLVRKLPPRDRLKMLLLCKALRKRLLATPGMLFQVLQIVRPRFKFFLKYPNVGTGITELDVTMCKTFESALLPKVFPNLERLTLRKSCGGFVAASIFPSDFGGCTSVKSLSLDGLAFGPSEIANILATIPPLRALYLNNCQKGVNDDTVIQICDRFPMLKTLDISWCNNLSVSAFTRLRSLKHLRSLDAYCCNRMNRKDYDYFSTLEHFDCDLTSVIDKKIRQ